MSAKLNAARAKPLRLKLALAAALAAFATPALAQTEPPAGDRTYEAADFARFAPQTALDMLNQTPGFTIREAAVERGLGQATGNVLLNGRRISNKSDDILAQLRRISAGNVVRIEIRDGASFGIPGLSGQVANVVTTSSGIQGQWAYRPEFREYFTDPLLTRFEASLSGELGPVQYTLALDNLANHSGAGGDTEIRDAAGVLLEHREDIWTSKYNQPRLSGRFVFDGPGTSVGNLNVSLRTFMQRYREDGDWTVPGDVDRERQIIGNLDGWDHEIGGDYEFGLGPGRLKLIGLDRGETYDDETIVTFDYADASPRTGDRSFTESEVIERVLRGEYSWRAAEADWQISGEYAFNVLDATTQIFSLEPDGSETEIPFPQGDARVEENRYEVMGTYGRSLTPSLSIQLSAGGEYSELAQVGANGVERTFLRPKGHVSAVWQRDADTTISARLQRVVGQLDFYDFLASRDLSDGTSYAGNPNLVPPQSWEGQVELARNFGDWGNATLRVYGALIEDIVDIIPVGADEESVGNLESAIQYGVEWRATTNFDPMGMTGLRLDSAFTLQESEVDDPLTGQPREISSNLLRAASLTLRYDMPNTDWAFGGQLRHQRYSSVYRLGELARQYEMPVGGSVFVENKDVYGLTVRFQIANLFYGESYLDRVSHEDGRRTSPIAFIEDRDRTIGPIFGIDIRGRF